MAADRSYEDSLKESFGSVIDSLRLDDGHKAYLRGRWLDQVLWMERKAESTKKKYYSLRLITIIGGVTVPALVSLNLSGRGEVFVGWLTFAISLMVAVSAAVEEFFHYGERWRHYRRTVEELKSAGWEFFQLAGRYRRYRDDPAGAYPLFAARVEQLLRQDVEAYITEVVHEKEEEQQPVRLP
ncbi:MAG: DUF4231 domain-containing protein [Actinomycetota bacterium]|nr:DUF4231 domain-containing protein [Actinomycetota bacterium]